jgi:ubiquinone/menaquinone biosynthesis C-methylase UbiE
MASPSPIPPVRHRWSAAIYDRMARLDDKKMRPFRELIAGGAKGRVLELGCGTGLNFEHYDWAQVEAVEATEPDPFMLRRAESRRDALSGAAQAKLNLMLSPAETLPFDDASFDTAVATLVFCTVADQQRALAEARRVLKPGGELRLMEHVAAGGTTGRIQRAIQPVYGWVAAGCQLGRDTEHALKVAGFDLQIIERTALGPLWPTFVGIARPQQV